eukprot:comp18788_c0_seq1/m.20704 comp18788_c0_seq1/g.20704  ORF comp18788_c0_seq1/g.20704 comp18788_c0_seq1/m.20704 type:complete len:341 (-) comp18788_c0_seq1:534-1556(-)
MTAAEKRVVYSADEVAAHKTADNLWITRNGRVYDVTSFAQDHPGGPDLILMYGGKDVTDVMADPFEHKHSESAYEVLKEYYIGEMDENSEHKAHNESEADPNFIDITKPMMPQMWYNNFTKEYYVKQVHIARHVKDGSSAPIFADPRLEFLSLTPWYMIPIIWLPWAGLWMYLASTVYSVRAVWMMFAIGVVHWTLVEYSMHRFVFHVDDLMPDHPKVFFFHFFTHGVHHFLPMDRYRLVMPPALFFILMSIVFHMYRLIFSFETCCGVGAGTVFGYVCYDLMHFYVHHGRPLTKYLREMKTYHLNHHYMNFSEGFGITSKFWDKLFNTELIYPIKAKAA